MYDSSGDWKVWNICNWYSILYIVLLQLHCWFGHSVKIYKRSSLPLVAIPNFTRLLVLKSLLIGPYRSWKETIRIHLVSKKTIFYLGFTECWFIWSWQKSRFLVTISYVYLYLISAVDVKENKHVKLNITFGNTSSVPFWRNPLNRN